MNPDRRPERPGRGPIRPVATTFPDDFADDVIRKLNPRGPIETMIAGRVIESARELKKALDRQGARDEVAEGNPDKAPSSARRASAADRALRSMREALETLDALQARRPSGPKPVIEPILESDPAPEVVAFDPFFDGDASDWTLPPFDVPEPAEGEAPAWKNRLVFDFEVSDISPVVKGTWITVSHVVSLIVDGHTWADILRTHPELNQDDIHACMAFALDELNEAK
ncbi:DUF433 domain-containing protein [Tundrisphaera sp. TA3]|uniref:DUF433 domain-containing protein n=1 Tax=Tundrisphaera sp. TA3 TaxID=3435775 RepID=UPI003EBF94F2